MGTCGNCGSAIDATDRFCDQCGTLVPPAATPAAPSGGDVADGLRPLFGDGDPGGPRASPGGADADADAGAAASTAVEPAGSGGGPPTEVVTLTAGVDLAECPACGSVNAVQRRHCARCGVVLDSDSADADVFPDGDVEPPLASDPGTSPASTAGPARRGPRGLGVVIVVIGAIVGAVLAAWVFGLGPFDRSGGHGVDFAGASYPGQAGRLSPASVATTPVREPAGGRTFTANLATDGRLETAWVAVDGDDASLTFRFDRPVWIVAVEVGNGDQYDDQSFTTTARVRTLGVDFGFGSRLGATLISGTGRQGFRPPEPVLTDVVALDVVDRTEGVDVALSEITFVGFEADADDAEAFADAT